MDLALSGCNSGGGYVASCDNGAIVSKIYLNNGTTLTENSQWGSNLNSVWRSALTFGDIDNNGKLDLILSGGTDSSYISKIYLNNGTTLTESSQWQQNLTGIAKSSVVTGDIDNDGDLDLVISGRDINSNKLTKIYINNGTSLVESSQWQNNLVNVDDSSLALSDFDNDGDLDLSLTGCCDLHRIYRNNGTTFVEIQKELVDLGGIFAGSQAFGDYDNDGDLDLITNGREGYTLLYLYNPSTTNFTSIYVYDPESSVVDMYYSSIAWLDLDNDIDLDLIETGLNTAVNVDAKVYISNRSLTKNNTKPSPQNSSFSTNYVNNILTLSWGNGSDAETNTSGLYYNLRVGNSTNNNSIVSGVYGGSSNPTAGYFGNMMQRKSISLNMQLEANKTYYWYVQTIDTGLAKSNWSAMQNFTTAIDVTKPNITINYPSPNASLHTINPYFIFNATVTDANLTNVTLYANWNGTMIANETNSSGINGTYIFNRNLTGNNDGQYSWYIYACDGTSNCQTSGTRSFYLDRNYPVVRLISPSDGGSWTDSNVVTFSYNITDVDIANCSLIINNAIVNTSTSVNENTEQNLSYSLSNGNYNWYVNCSDYVGYTNSSLMRSLSVSYTAPSGGNGGGGGGGVSTKTYSITNEQLSKGYNQILSEKDKINFIIDNKNHSLIVNKINKNLSYANLSLNSKLINFIIYVNEEKKFDVNDDKYYDFYIKLNNIFGNKANITIKSVREKVSEISEGKKEEKVEEEIKSEKGIKELKEKKIGKFRSLILIGFVFGLIILLIIFFVIKFKFLNKFKKRRKSGRSKNR